MSEIMISTIVRSLSGRDRGRLFVVTDREPGYVFLADGRTRRVERPKKKKFKHVEVFPCGASRTGEKILNGEKVTNSEIRRMLQEMTEGSETES